VSLINQPPIQQIANSVNNFSGTQSSEFVFAAIRDTILANNLLEINVA
jgi:hypothetical protein